MSLELDNIGVRFGDGERAIQALQDVTLLVSSTEFVCFVGLSGCGKSTLLNVVAGFVPTSSGAVRHNKEIIVGPSAKRAVVFQEDAVFPWFTVLENVAYGLSALGSSKSRRKLVTQQYVKLVGLEAFAEYYPKALSGGMKKRVDLARAYAANAEVLLMDEPFGALDIHTREVMQTELQRIQALEPKTILFVTHDIAEALFLADRVVVMTPRPGSIQSIIEVPFARPRSQALKKEPEFLALLSMIEQTLGDAV